MIKFEVGESTGGLMLSNVHVKNFALIDEADIELSKGLNILTGETGAGKSILLGAINLALGARTSKDVVRTNAEYCLAELTFTDFGDSVKKVAAELGIEECEDELVISRKLSTGGKSVIRINGETVSAAQARMLTSELIDIYGQSEHLSLMDEARHLDIVDRFLGPDAVSLKHTIGEEHREYSRLRAEFAGLENDPARRAREIDRIRSEISEIEQAQVREGEEEDLKDERRLLANASLITEALSNVSSYLYGNDGAGDLLSASVKAVGHVSEFDGELGAIYDELCDIDSRISDAYRDCRNYLDGMADPTERLSEADDRLDTIRHIKSKYGNTVEAIEDYLEDDKVQLERLIEFEAYAEKLERDVAGAYRKLEQHAKELSRLRMEASEILKRQIGEALRELNFNQVRFDIEFSQRSEIRSDGADDAAFLISLNPGEELRPITKVASGGEMSRIMLAIKSVFAKKETIGTLIFDEIDAGISGITAQKVSDKLCTIASAHQVICITHLPQIAAMADYHLKVEKNVVMDTTKVTITPLDEAGSLNELGRILSGEELSDSVMKAATDIRNGACSRKVAIRARE